MKKLYKYSILLMAAFLFAPLATRGQLIDLDKKVRDNGDGSYSITLETYTTGTATVTNTSKPTDIVLVLDLSRSMALNEQEGIITKAMLDSELNGLSPTLENLYSVCKSDYFFTTTAHANNTAYTNIYWREEDGTWKRRQGRIYENSTPQFGATHVDFNPNNTEATVSGTTSLATETTYCTYRLFVLTAAAKAFADQVYRDAMYEEDGITLRETPTDHRICIDGFNSTTIGQYSGLELGLTSVSSGLNTIKTTINGLNLRVNNGTYSGTALQTARQVLWEAAAGDNASGRNRLVVFFTDGRVVNDTEGANAVNAARDMKGSYTNNNISRNINAQIYSVGLFSSSDNSIHQFMNAISSNYPNASRSGATYTMGDPAVAGYSATTPNQGYYKMTTTGANLGDIFEDIASNVQTETAEITEATVVLDVMTGYFRLPEGVTVNDINLYTCAANVANSNHTDINQLKWASTQAQAGEGASSNGQTVYKDADNNVVSSSTTGGWTEYWEPWTPWDTATVAGGNVKSYYLTVSETDRSVQVTGFDYKKYAVVPITNATTSPYWAGRKLIIEFVIWPDVANPGGATLNTNEATSGVRYTYIDKNGQTQTYTQYFDVPVVTLPNIIIRKYGMLYQNEGATFRLEKLKLKAGGTESVPTDWEVDTTVKPYFVLVNSVDDNVNTFDFVQVKLQHPGRYRVTETDWGWTYNCTADVSAAVQTETNKSGKLVATYTSTNTKNQPYIDRDVSGDTEQTIDLPGGGQLSGAVFNFRNAIKLKEGSTTEPLIEKRNYSEAHKTNEFPTKTRTE